MTPHLAEPVIHSDIELSGLVKLSRDVKIAAATLSPREIRYLVDSYYQLQEYRKATANQARSMEEEPHEVISWLETNTNTLERNIKIVLDTQTSSTRIGRWAKSIVGVGPVIAAGLASHIDITKAPTVGHIWRFAGLDPTMEWSKGQKRPWNAQLKTLCWKIGESFVKFSNHEGDFYGKLWRERKDREIERNVAGELADQAAAKLEKFKIGKSTEAYKSYSEGRLPDGHIHARAKRWAVKLFLAHWHHVAYECHFGVEPPKPYALTQLGHAHEITVPNWPME